MAPIAGPSKRRAQSRVYSHSDVERDESEAGSASSSQTGSRKRRRLTNGPSDNDDSDQEAPRYPLYFDSDNEEAFELLATQAVQEKYALHKDNTPAECGILEEVRVENFMCHEICIFQVGPLINFICGKNGSGKSAILTAITLCLGGKATSTNRGSSLKNFIKEGKENGYILIKIKNQGEGAYMPDVYGETIQVERHFNRAGASGFKLRSSAGKIISTKKAELEEICDHFALQIDNPMNVLSQDAARSFITSSSAIDKYKSFVRGVQLEQLDQDYRLIEQNLDQIDEKLEEKRPDVAKLMDQMEKAKSKLTQADRHNKTLDRLRDLRRQRTWQQVEDQEKIRDDYIAAIDEAENKIGEVQQEVDDLSAAYEEADNRSIEATNAFEAAKNDVLKVQAEKAEERIKFDAAKKDRLEGQTEQRQIKSTLRTAEKTVEAKRKEIELEEERLVELDGGGAAARLAALEEARSSVKQARVDQDEHQKSKVNLFDEQKSARAVYEERRQRAETRQADVKKQETDVNAFAGEKDNEDLGFTSQLPALLQAIQREQRFTQKPVGPLGKHVRLLEPKWSSIIETSFGSTLNSFIVTSKSDMNILNQIMKKLRCQCPIVIANNQRLDLTNQEPHENVVTTLRVLEIDNDLVRKQLVIAHSIENTALIEHLEDASEFLYSGDKPRNVKMCFSLDPEDNRRGYRQAYSRQNQPTQDPVREYKGKARMKTDFDAQLRVRREALEGSKRQLLSLEQEYRHAQDLMTKAGQTLVRHKNRADELRIALQEAEDNVEKIMDAIKEDSTEGGKLEVLRNALTEAQSEKEVHAGFYEDSVVSLDTKKTQLLALTASLEAFDDRISELQEIENRLDIKAKDLSKARARAIGDKNAAVSRIEDARDDVRTLETKRDEQITFIARFIEQAQLISQRVNVPNGETEESLKAKYEKLDAAYQKMQNQMGATREEIADEAARTSTAYEKGERDLHKLEAIGQKMKISLLERRNRWRAFRSFITVRAKAQFTYLLSERSFRGSLDTDHREQTLELSVEPDITKRNGTGRGAKTLSGGEKSFSQICLLLAIWEAMGSPIRCLDEFDVFMDAVNRNMSVKLLIEAARQSVGRQFIFISPGSKSDIKQGDDVKAIEMAAPERGQTRLNFEG